MNKENVYNFNSSKLRNKLLRLGRVHEGTHFIWLDADEAISKTFSENGKDLLQKMIPGEKIFMNWLSMWKSFNRYRVDSKSLWKPQYKDFIVCDDGKSTFNEETKFHESRTQGTNTNIKYLDFNDAFVLHFQFSNWQNYLNKQVYYMIREYYNIQKENIGEINRKYFFTYYENSPKTKLIPNKEISHLNIKVLENLVNENTENFWKKTFDIFFAKNDISKIKNMNIWHNQICYKIYVKKLNKIPKLNIFEKLKINLFLYKFKLLSMIKNKD